MYQPLSIRSLKLAYIIIHQFLLLFFTCCSEFLWLLIYMYLCFFPLGTSAVCHLCHGEHKIWSARCHGHWGTRLITMLLTGPVTVIFHMEWHCKNYIYLLICAVVWTKKCASYSCFFCTCNNIHVTMHV